MALIREEIFNFVDSWNNHKIRKQRNRAHHPTGRPFMMYFHPAEGIENFGCQVEALHLQEIKSHVDDYGPYTPSHIFNTNGIKSFYTRYSFIFTTGCFGVGKQNISQQ